MMGNFLLLMLNMQLNVKGISSWLNPVVYDGFGVAMIVLIFWGFHMEMDMLDWFWGLLGIWQISAVINKIRLIVNNVEVHQ